MAEKELIPSTSVRKFLYRLRKPPKRRLRYAPPLRRYMRGLAEEEKKQWEWIDRQKRDQIKI